MAHNTCIYGRSLACSDDASSEHVAPLPLASCVYAVREWFRCLKKFHFPVSAEKTSAPAEHPKPVYSILSAALFTCPQGTMPALYIPVKDPPYHPFLTPFFTPLHHMAVSFIHSGPRIVKVRLKWMGSGRSTSRQASIRSYVRTDMDDILFNVAISTGKRLIRLRR